MTLRRRIGGNALAERQGDELAAVLARLVGGVRGAVGGGLVGVYLIGSFALGAGDEYSDVDFLVVTDGELGDDTAALVRRLHATLPDEESQWARHLEGSYVSRAGLAGSETHRRPWLYVNNGSRVMERSTHDNTAVTRWVLREHGVTLCGPEPQTLVEPVSPERLRAEAVLMARRLAEAVRRDPEELRNAWAQPHFVLALCRFLFTLATGEVTSKKAAGEWALRELDPCWAALIQHALDDRPDPWQRVHRTGDPETVEATPEFVAYGVARAEQGGRDLPPA